MSRLIFNKNTLRISLIIGVFLIFIVSKVSADQGFTCDFSSVRGTNRVDVCQNRRVLFHGFNHSHIRIYDDGASIEGLKEYLMNRFVLTNLTIDASYVDLNRKDDALTILKNIKNRHLITNLYVDLRFTDTDDYDLIKFLNTLRPFYNLQDLTLLLTIAPTQDSGRSNRDITKTLTEAFSRLERLRNLTLEFHDSDFTSQSFESFNFRDLFPILEGLTLKIFPKSGTSVPVATVQKMFKYQSSDVSYATIYLRRLSFQLESISTEAERASFQNLLYFLMRIETLESFEFKEPVNPEKVISIFPYMTIGPLNPDLLKFQDFVLDASYQAGETNLNNLLNSFVICIRSVPMRKLHLNFAYFGKENNDPYCPINIFNFPGPLTACSTLTDLLIDLRVYPEFSNPPTAGTDQLNDIQRVLGSNPLESLVLDLSGNQFFDGSGGTKYSANLGSHIGGMTTLRKLAIRINKMMLPTGNAILMITNAISTLSSNLEYLELDLTHQKPDASLVDLSGFPAALGAMKSLKNLTLILSDNSGLDAADFTGLHNELAKLTQLETLIYKISHSTVETAAATLGSAIKEMKNLVNLEIDLSYASSSTTTAHLTQFLVQLRETNFDKMKSFSLNLEGCNPISQSIDPEPWSHLFFKFKGLTDFSLNIQNPRSEYNTNILGGILQAICELDWSSTLTSLRIFLANTYSGSGNPEVMALFANCIKQKPHLSTLQAGLLAYNSQIASLLTEIPNVICVNQQV